MDAAVQVTARPTRVQNLMLPRGRLHCGITPCSMVHRRQLLSSSGKRAASLHREWRQCTAPKHRHLSIKSRVTSQRLAHAPARSQQVETHTWGSVATRSTELKLRSSPNDSLRPLITVMATQRHVLQGQTQRDLLQAAPKTGLVAQMKGAET